MAGTSFASLLRNTQPVYDAAVAPAATPGGGGLALSQMTRCAKASANLTRLRGYDPCAKTPGAASLYSFMGYSIRSTTWRLTVWARWDHATLCPDWADRANQLELCECQTYFPFMSPPGDGNDPWHAICEEAQHAAPNPTFVFETCGWR